MAYYSSEGLLRCEDSDRNKAFGKLQKRMETDVKLERWLRAYVVVLFPSTKRKARQSVLSPSVVICL